MNKCQQTPAHTCAKNDKPNADKLPNISLKKKQAVQKLTELTSLFDQDIYIAIKDKKTHKVTEYTSGEGFRIEQVAAQLLSQNKIEKKATQGLKDILEAFKKVIDDDCTAETKSTSSRLSPEKTDGADERCADDQKINMAKTQIAACPFPSQEETAGAFLLQEQHSEAEQDDQEEAAFGFKQLEAIAKEKVDPTMEHLIDEDECRGSDSHYLSHARRCTDYDDFVHRVNSRRGDFAQKHLFKNGFKEDEIDENLSDASSESQSSLGDSDMVDASGYSEDEEISAGHDLTEPIPTNVEAGVPQSTAGSNYHASCELSHDGSLPISTKTVNRNENNSKVKTCDMFFSCADWENLVDAKQEEAKGDKLVESVLSDSSELSFEQPKQCKRKTKQQEKLLEATPSKILPLKRSKPLENIDVTTLLSTQQAEPCIKRRVTSNIAGLSLPLKPLNLQDKVEEQMAAGGETQSLSPMGLGAHVQASVFSAALLKK